jgi:hypothetical protein
MAGSQILTPRRVKRFTVSLAETGSVFTDALYELHWAKGGFYRCSIRVSHRVPVVMITETYDLGRLDGSDFWELDLMKGWKRAPDGMEWMKPFGNGTVKWGWNGKVAQLSKSKSRNLSGPTDADYHLMIPDFMHWARLGLFNSENRKAFPDTFPMLGIMMMHKGEWRRMNVLQVHSKDPGDLRVRTPMTARDMTWKRDTGSVTSPFSMHSFDPQTSKTLGKRVWALMLAPVELPKAETATVKFGMLYHGMAKYSDQPLFGRGHSIYGVIGLDRYKNYILNWEDTGVQYPKVYHPGKTPQQLQEDLVASSLPEKTKAILRKTYCSYLWGKPGYEKARTKQLTRAVDKYLKSYAAILISCPTPSHHGLSTGAEGAGLVDDLLAQPDLPPEVRRDLRARIALVNYLHQEPDAMNFGTGAHPGNPNMGTARFYPGIAYIPLAADHPMYEQWKKRAADYTEYKLGTLMAPGGGYAEYGTYHVHGLRLLASLPAIAAMNTKNRERIYDYARQDLDYLMNLIAPKDSRYHSRVLPGLANSAPLQLAAYIQGAKAFETIDPAFAAKLRWCWDENGQRVENGATVPLAIKASKPDLRSRAYPGFGVIFRAHQGPEETWMLFRNGFLWSHWYIDPGHILFSSRGATLLPQQCYQYFYAQQNKDFDRHNTVRFGHAENEMPYGWPDSNILAHDLEGEVQYAWSSTGVPDWFIRPGVAEAFKIKVDKIPNGGSGNWIHVSSSVRGHSNGTDRSYSCRRRPQPAPATPFSATPPAGKGRWQVSSTWTSTGVRPTSRLRRTESTWTRSSRSSSTLSSQTERLFNPISSKRITNPSSPPPI